MGGQSDQKHEESCACGLGVGPCPEHSDPADEDRPTQKAAGITPTTEWTKPPKCEVTAPRPVFNGYPAKAPKLRKIKIPPQVASKPVNSWQALMPGMWKENARVRDDLAKRLGFKDFASYVKSPIFWKIRAAVLARDAKTCYVCGGKASLCHFASYNLKAMEGSDLGSLFAVCYRCTKTTSNVQEQSPRTQSAGSRACPGTMKNLGPCTLNADRNRSGTWYCHLHDPLGTYMRNSRSCASGGGSQPMKTVIPAPH